MMNGTNLTNLTVGIRTEFCETHLFLGRPNDQLEGFNDLISKANGVADAILKSSDTPNYKVLETRPTSLFMRIKVDVLSDLEPNGEDLTKIDPRVGTKNKILVEKTGKSAWMIMTIAWVTALAGTVSLLTA